VASSLEVSGTVSDRELSEVPIRLGDVGRWHVSDSELLSLGGQLEHNELGLRQAPTQRVHQLPGVGAFQYIWNPADLISRHIPSFTVIWRYRVVYQGIWRVHTNNATIQFSYLGILFW
jgi:hypothetical protein